VSLPSTLNDSLPLLSSSSYTVDLTPTKIRVHIPTAIGYEVRVPVLVHSYVTESETPYNFFYKTNAYQGLLDSTAYYGKVVKEGPAIITSLGSGAVTNYTYSTGRASFSSGKTVYGVVDEYGNLPKWLSYATAGDYIGQNNSSQFYRISSVDSDVALTLAETFVDTDSTLPGETFLPAAVSVADSTIEVILPKVIGDVVRFSNVDGALPGNIVGAMNYYVVLGGTSIKISTTVGGAPVDFVDQGTGVHTLITKPINAVYSLYKIDVPKNNISNVVDRLPALNISAVSSEDLVDYRCYSDELVSGSLSQLAMLITEPKQKAQDLLNTMVNDFTLGSIQSKRGRSNIILTEGKNDIFKLSSTPRPHIYYDTASTGVSGHAVKVYQAYLFNMSAKGQITGESDLTGRLYLMVVSGETKPINPLETSLNGFFDRDTVDIYELVGRPIVKL